MHRPITQLTKVYVEPTTGCNIGCVTCFRNDWDEPIGRMTEATFQRILDGLDAFTPRPTGYFGGIGEPLYNDFPPCTFCGGCEMSEDNLTDCMGNPFPACGACVWSQGAVQCP